MKTQTTQRQNGGSVLMVTLLTTAIVGFALASYLTLAGVQNRSTVRSQTWNAAIPMVEAGIEEALAHLNKNGTTNITRDGWSSQGSNVYRMTRSIGDCYYIVDIDATVPNTPVVTSQGFVTTVVAMKSSDTFFAVAGPGQSGTQQTVTNFVSRKVRVTAGLQALYSKGMVAKGSIGWTGNIYTDSFDSQDPAYSTGSRYDPTKRKDKGSIASNGGNIDLGGGQVFGDASTGPTGYVTNGVVGTTNYIAGGGTGIQAGHYANDMNVQFPDLNPPFTGSYFTPGPGAVTTTNTISTTNNVSSYPYPTNPAATQISGVWTTNLSSYPSGAPYVTSNRVVTTTGNGKNLRTVTNITYNATNWYYSTVSFVTNLTTVTYDYILDTGNYQLPSLAMSGLSKMLVRGDAVLYLPGGLSMSGQSEIDIAVGGSLRLYTGANVSLSGNGIQNANNDSLKFSMFGLPGCTSIDLGGNASFTGTIYAPQATFYAHGGGNNQYDCVGAVIVNSVNMNGHFTFHYDEALARNGPSQGYQITSWNEL